jgi:hypothetical protein
MSTWAWDLIGSLAALFILVVTAVDVLIAIMLVKVLRHRHHEHATTRATEEEPVGTRSELPAQPTVGSRNGVKRPVSSGLVGQPH